MGLVNELFTAIAIDNPTYPNGIKLQHSLNSVRGPAKAALKEVSASSADFQVAWQKLLRRYYIAKHKLFNYLEAFIELRSVSRASAADLSSLVDKAEEIVKGLKNLQYHVEHFDIWFVHLIERKLDPDTRLGWAIHEDNVENFSTYENILKFLECRITSLKTPTKLGAPSQGDSRKNKVKNIERNSGNSGKQISSHVTQEASAKSQDKSRIKKRFKCSFCTEEHSLYRCQKFLALDPDGRANFIESKKMCECCFSAKHKTSDCPKSFSCTVYGCKAKHNALLHKEMRSSQSRNVVSNIEV